MAEPCATFTEQIACLKREIAMREKVYPRQVMLKRMRQEVADQELATMLACLTSLVRLAYLDIVRRGVNHRSLPSSSVVDRFMAFADEVEADRNLTLDEEIWFG